MIFAKIIVFLVFFNGFWLKRFKRDEEDVSCGHPLRRMGGTFAQIGAHLYLQFDEIFRSIQSKGCKAKI